MARRCRSVCDDASPALNPHCRAAARVRTVFTVLLWLLAGQALAAAEPAQPLYLQVVLNHVDRQLIVRVEQQDGELFMTAEELAAIGVITEGLPADAAGRIALKDIPGARHEYAALDQRLYLSLPDAVLQPQTVSYQRPPEAVPHSDTGLVIGYAFNAQRERIAQSRQGNRLLAPLIESGYARTPTYTEAAYGRAFEERNRSLAIGSDLRLFSPAGLFINTGYSTLQAGEAGYTRQDSYWTYASLDPMRSYTVGDYITSSLSWTRALRMGGARVARNFSLRPDLVTFPVPALGGSAVVPTTVDLYVNGVRQFSVDAQPGPFVISSPPALTGAGEVSLVYQDALGREVSTTRPLYIDARMLESGLSDYAIEVGYARQMYGSRSFEYAEDPAGMMSLRYGVNDAITLEGHGEWGKGLGNGGLGGLFRFASYGVLNAAVAYSDGDSQGLLTAAGYQYISPRWGFEVYDRRAHDDYRDLGTLEGIPVPRRLTRGSFSLWFPHSQAVTLTYAEQRTTSVGGTRIAAIGYNANWYGSRIGTYLNVFKDLDDDTNDGVYFGFSWAVGERATVYASASRYGEQDTVTLGANSPTDYDLGGFGWAAHTEAGNDDYLRGSARIDYRSRYGDWAARIDHAELAGGAYTNSSLYGTGSIVYMDGQLLAARPIYDGFALVSTRGVADVPVLRENRLLGQTNERGYLLVPDLPSYRTSRIAIDQLPLPVDVSLGTDRLLANPRELSGVLVEFPLGRYQGAVATLVDEQRRPLPVGSRATLAATGESFVVGYDGQVFLPHLQPRNRLEVTTGEGTCVAEVVFQPAQSMHAIGPFICAEQAP